MFILGKKIDMDSPEWVNELSDMISSAREREAVTDLSVLAQGLITEIALLQGAALQPVNLLMRTDPDGTIIQSVYKHDIDKDEVMAFMAESFNPSVYRSIEWEWETETVESKPII
jgi:hypothetical protein